jgi:predicted ATPase
LSTPLELYQEDLKRDDFSYDADQEKAVKHLQRLYDDLVASYNKSKKKGPSGVALAVVKLIWSILFLMHCRLNVKCVLTFTVLCSVFTRI